MSVLFYTSSILHGSYISSWLLNWTTDCYHFQSMQDEMMDLMDISTEIQESLGRSYNVPDDIDEEDLMGGMLKLEF